MASQIFLQPWSTSQSFWSYDHDDTESGPAGIFGLSHVCQGNVLVRRIILSEVRSMSYHASGKLITFSEVENN